MFIDEESAAIITAAVNELRQFDPPYNWRAHEAFWREAAALRSGSEEFAASCR
jgi:hypothetical protein